MTRLLLVDDEAGLRKGLAAYLRGCGYQVLEAGGVAEARSQVEGTLPDVVITDQCMDDGKGTELAAWLVEREVETRVIVVTGFADRDLFGAKRPPGVDLVLEKPVRPRELQQAIRRFFVEIPRPEVPTGDAGTKTDETDPARQRRELRASLWGEDS